MTYSDKSFIDSSEITEDLGIEKLQQKISHFYRISRSPEINLVTKLFIEQLANNLELIPIPADSFPLTNFPPLPQDFPQSLEMPIYLYGDRVFHELMDNYAIVIGRFCAFDRDLKQWRWKYLILNNQNVAINSFFSSRVCWETELQLTELEQ